MLYDGFTKYAKEYEITLELVRPASTIPAGRSLPFISGCVGLPGDTAKKEWLRKQNESLASQYNQYLRQDYCTQDQMRGAWFEMIEGEPFGSGWSPRRGRPFVPFAFRARGGDGGPVAQDGEPGCEQKGLHEGREEYFFSLEHMHDYCLEDPLSFTRPRAPRYGGDY